MDALADRKNETKLLQLRSFNLYPPIFLFNTFMRNITFTYIGESRLTFILKSKQFTAIILFASSGVLLE